MFYIYPKHRTGPDKEKAPNKYLLNNSFYVQNDPKKESICILEMKKLMEA